jgi:hypothetical protein
MLDVEEATPPPLPHARAIAFPSIVTLLTASSIVTLSNDPAIVTLSNNPSTITLSTDTHSG